eukprot:435388-Hanusia_phi.AAC.1
MLAEAGGEEKGMAWCSCGVNEEARCSLNDVRRRGGGGRRRRKNRAEQKQLQGSTEDKTFTPKIFRRREEGEGKITIPPQSSTPQTASAKRTTLTPSSSRNEVEREGLNACELVHRTTKWQEGRDERREMRGGRREGAGPHVDVAVLPQDSDRLHGSKTGDDTEYHVLTTAFLLMASSAI